MTDEELVIHYFKRVMELNSRMKDLDKEPLTQERVDKKMGILKEMMEVHDELTELKNKRDEQKGDAGKRPESDNQRKGSEYDTFNQEWPEA